MLSLVKAAAVAAVVLTCAAAHAEVIGFEDLNIRDSFYLQGPGGGIAGTYAGYRWSDNLAGNLGINGWASATNTIPAVSPAPAGLTGHSYAWTYNGPQSLFIAFGAAKDVVSVDLAQLSENYFGGNSNSVRLYGYDASNQVVASSATLNLTTTFQTLVANFQDVYKLELRSDRPSWFAVDQIVLDAPSSEASAAPLPAVAPAGLALLGGLGLRRGRRKVAGE